VAVEQRVDTVVLRLNTCMKYGKCKDFCQKWHQSPNCFSQALNYVRDQFFEAWEGGRGVRIESRSVPLVLPEYFSSSHFIPDSSR